MSFKKFSSVSTLVAAEGWEGGFCLCMAGKQASRQAGRQTGLLVLRVSKVILLAIGISGKWGIRDFYCVYMC